MLQITDLSVRYDADCALQGINLSAQMGERIALMGANGAGKSTLLLTICGVLDAASGEISVCDIPVEKRSLTALRQKLAVVFQNPDDQLFMPTVYEDIAFGPRNHGMDENTVEERADAVLARLGIAHLKDRMTHRLSGGEKRLVTLAGVLVMEPEILLLDEPTTFLDPRAKRRFLELLKELHQTMLIATHDPGLALALCSRVVLLKEGRLLADCSVEEAFGNAQLLDACGLEPPLGGYSDR